MNYLNTKKKILWAVPRSFLPICDGASKANAALLESFFSNTNPFIENFEVTLLIFISNIGDIDISLLKKKYLEAYPIHDVVFVQKKLLGTGLKRIFQVLRNLFSRDPATASFFNLSENRKVLHHLSQSSFDYVLIDGLHTYCGLKDIFKTSSFIYRSHNVEYDLWNIDDATVVTRIILKTQSKKMKRLEYDLISKARATWTISNVDRSTYISDLHLSEKYINKIDSLPMALPFNKRHPAKSSSSLNFLFVGKLDWHPNFEGLMWFLKEVAPSLNDDITISIVGRGDFPSSDFDSLEHVKFLGFVEDLDLLYQEHDACLIPIFSGSGTRIKVIEALASGTPILTTSFGIQGSAMESTHCLISDEAEKWISYLNNWNREVACEKAQKAQHDLESLYGLKSVGEKFKNLL